MHMLTELGVEEAEQWLWPELETWESEVEDRCDIWKSLYSRAECWLDLWISKYKVRLRADILAVHFHQPLKYYSVWQKIRTVLRSTVTSSPFMLLTATVLPSPFHFYATRNITGPCAVMPSGRPQHSA